MESLRYGLYVRKSTESEDRQVLSIEAQMRKAHEIFPTLRVFKKYDERRSAFEPGRRPVFQSLLDDIDRGRADGVIAWHPDRLSRNEEDAAKMTYRVRKGVIKDLVFCSYHFDNSPEGIMMLQLALSQSQYFSAKLSKDVLRGLEQKVEMGWRPGIPPIGYLNDVVTHTVVVDRDRFPIVRRMWDVLLTGFYTPPRVGQMAVTEWGLTTPPRKNSGGRPVARSNIYKIFRNPFYAGFIRHNGKLYKGKHQPMVTIDEFHKVQELLDRTSRLSQKLIRREFAYTGLVICLECGCQYTAEVQKGHAYYHCTRHKTGVPCGQTTYIREEVLDEAIKGELGRHTIHPALRQWALDHLEKTRALEAEKDVQVQESRQGRIQELKERLDRLVDMKIKELVSDDDFAARQEAMKAEIEQLAQQAKLAAERRERVYHETRRVFDLATYGVAVLKRGSLRKRRTIARALGQRYCARDGKITISVREWIIPIGEATPAFHDVPLPEPPQTRPLALHKLAESENMPRYARTGDFRDNCSTADKTAAFASALSLWLGTVDRVRTIIDERLDDVYVPEFDPLGDLMDDTV